MALYYRVIRPFQELREILRRLAAQDFRPVLMKSRHAVLHETIGHVRKISELLQQFDRQVTDEVFAVIQGERVLHLRYRVRRSPD